VTSPFDDPEFRRQMAAMGVRRQPGMAKRMLDQIAPLLADEGIDLENLDGSDLDAVNAALARATERHNLMLFTPVGKHRALALSVLRRFTMAIGDDDLRAAQKILDDVPIEETDSMPAVSHVIGAALGLLDSRHTDPALASVRQRMRVPAWPSKEAVAASRDIVPLSNRGRAFDSLDSLIVRHNGQNVMVGAALAVAASVLAEARVRGRDVVEVAASALTDGEADAVLPPAANGAGGRAAAPRRADEALALSFQAWLDEQDEIAAPDVGTELRMFRSLQKLAREWVIDLDDPDDVETFAEMLGEEPDDAEGALFDALDTLHDYVHMRLASDRAGWADAHDALEDVLLDGSEGDGGALLQDALAGGQDIPEEERHRVLRRLPVVFSVGRLLEWIGAGRPVSSTGALRRADIQRVAAMIGVSAVGVSRRMPAADGVEHVTSMNQLPLLSAWWQALIIAEVIELSPTRVRPGVTADAWHDRMPLELTEFLAALVAAQVIANAYIGLDDDRERFTVTDTVSRVVAALGNGSDFIADEPGLRMLNLERTGFVTRSASGIHTVPDALRSTVARAVTMVISTHLVPGVVDGFMDELGGAE